jgi:chorismate lyase/3-hydroxybenzoate synthase
LPADKVEEYLRKQDKHVACVVGFGANPSASTDTGHSVLQVEMPVFEHSTVYEVWTTDKPVTPYREGAMAGALNEDVFFGSLSVRLDGSEDLSAAAQRAFTAIFDFLHRSDYPNLIRVWNYFPWINAVENGLERYRSFSVGRHEAFVNCERSVEDSPAACALGSYGGPLVIYFLASRFPGMQIENPRQVSAYSYPQQYGPRSPTFSRATLAYKDDPRILFVSGTASIVGHETVHPDSVEMQTRETLANIRAVIGQAVLKGFPEVDFANDMALKVYVRYTQDIPAVMEIVRDEYGPLAEVIALQADICRTDLLVEIEAVCWSPSR